MASHPPEEVEGCRNPICFTEPEIMSKSCFNGRYRPIHPFNLAKRGLPRKCEFVAKELTGSWLPRLLPHAFLVLVPAVLRSGRLRMCGRPISCRHPILQGWFFVLRPQ